MDIYNRRKFGWQYAFINMKVKEKSMIDNGANFITVSAIILVTVNKLVIRVFTNQKRVIQLFSVALKKKIDKKKCLML
jgi:hypothetical protein